MLSSKQRKFIELSMTTNLNEREKAEAVGIARETASRWKNNPEFQQAYDVAVMDSLKRASAMAMRNIVELASKAESENVRLQASKDILDRAGHKQQDTLEVKAEVNPYKELTSDDLKKLIESEEALAK